MKVTVKAYAKINLLLDILSKFENGYHNLFTVMQSVDLYDTIEIEKNDSGEITIECETQGVPCDERNIAYKAAKSFFDYCNIGDDRGVHIKIIKRIPHAAGLAGGSADGAAVIKALCEMYISDLTYSDKVKIAARVGADVPFCLFGGTCLCQNIGDVLSFLPPVPKMYIVLSKPTQAVATGGAYENHDRVADKIRHPDNFGMLHAVLEGDIDRISLLCNNVFEQSIEVCDRVFIKSVMRKHGASACCMSGSGPTVFGIFKDKDDAEKACGELRETIKQTYVCRPVNCGCEIIKTEV